MDRTIELSEAEINALLALFTMGFYEYKGNLFWGRVENFPLSRVVNNDHLETLINLLEKTGY